jgi:hypothetical protein
MSENGAHKAVLKTSKQWLHTAIAPLWPAVRNALANQQCPRCVSDRVYRSHRRSPWERAAALLVLPYRCEVCTFRFFRVRWSGGRQTF